LRGAAEGFGEADCHFRADAGALIDEVIQRLPGNAKDFRPRGYAQSERLKAFVPDDASGVRRVLHRHGRVPFQVMIDQIDIQVVCVVKIEDKHIIAYSDKHY